MRDLLRHRGFRLLLIGQTATVFSDWTLLLVFGIWGHALTGSNAVAGLMVFAMTAPGLLGPLGGLVADRVPRRWLLLGIDLISVPVVLALWCVHDRGQLWLLYTVAVWYGFSSVVASTAMSGLVQSMLPEQLVGPANGVLTTVRQGLRLVGPLVGAGLFAAVGGHAVATLDAATFLLSAAAVLAMRHPERRVPRAATPLLTSLGAGFAHLRGALPLRRLAVAEIGCMTAFGITEPAVYALIGDGLHRPASLLGVLVAVQGVGAIAGGIVATTTVARAGAARLFTVGLALLTATTDRDPVPSLQ